ncbi:MAG: PIN domain-containing protein [Candidatus Choladocola sp.]|nr:PIN domain-containing protein [Candidatus Choladocola sp.]
MFQVSSVGKRNYYFIDFENVQSAGLEGINDLTKKDEVYIFYSENANRISFELHHRLMHTLADVFYIPVEVGGKNALDFQLSSYLGYIIGQNCVSEADYYIVSKDMAFSYLVTFWKDRGVDLSVVHSLAEQKTDSIWQVLRDRVEELVSDGKLADRIVAIMQKCGTKQDLHTALMKDLWDIDSEKRGEIYRIIRPLFGKI